MKKLFTVIKKEYKDVVKKKTFILTTILTPVLMGAFVFIPGLLMKVAKSEKTIEVADYSRFMVEKLKDDTDTGISFKIIENPDLEMKDLIKKYEKKIIQKKCDALLIIPENVKKDRLVYYYSRNISDLKTNRFLSSTIELAVSEQILTEERIKPEIIREAIKKVNFETFKVKKEGTKKSSFSVEYMLSILMMTILFSVIMTYGTLLMRNVVAEKNNRIMEILISSTNSHTLFYGKILGLALAGLTQVGIWMILGFILINSFAFKVVENISDFISLEFCIYFVIFFLLGYLMYSILFAIVGASVNTDEEAQQLAAPVIYILIIPFVIGILVTQAPDIPIVTALSLFPLFSPTLMFMRISVVMPPFSQILLSIVLSVLMILFMAWIGAKIFRIGILMYGKKPSIKEIMKWLKYK